MTTDAAPQADRLDTWAVVELFGHTRIAGKVSEHVIAGGAFLRVDVPATDLPAFTRFFGSGAIYSISPCSEDVAHLVAKRLRAEPITVYAPELTRLPATTPAGPDDDGYSDLGDDDDDER